MKKEEKQRPIVVSSHDIQLDSNYVSWMYDVKQRFRNTQIRAAVKVNSEQLLFNWKMGRDLVVRKAEDIWGSGIVEQVSLDLQNEFPEAKGFSARNLWSMKKWYSFYALAPESYGLLQNLSEQIDSDSIKLHQVGAEIAESDNKKLHQVGAEMSFPTVFGFVPWRHHVEIISRCKSVEEALFYVQKTIEEGLSRSALIDIIKADLYHNFGAAITNFSERLPAVQGKLAQQIMKDTYDLSFVSLPGGYDEDALEEALEKNITQFLLELGTGFAFVGRQKEIVVSGKTRKNAVDELIRTPEDNPTIGLLICKDKDQTEVQWAFQGIQTPMGVASYDNIRLQEIQAQLPTSEQIQQRINLAEEEFRMGKQDNQK